MREGIRLRNVVAVFDGVVQNLRAQVFCARPVVFQNRAQLGKCHAAALKYKLLDRQQRIHRRCNGKALDGLVAVGHAAVKHILAALHAGRYRAGIERRRICRIGKLRLLIDIVDDHGAVLGEVCVIGAEEFIPGLRLLGVHADIQMRQEVAPAGDGIFARLGKADPGGADARVLKPRNHRLIAAGRDIVLRDLARDAEAFVAGEHSLVIQQHHRRIAVANHLAEHAEQLVGHVFFAADMNLRVVDVQLLVCLQHQHRQARRRAVVGCPCLADADRLVGIALLRGDFLPEVAEHLADGVFGLSAAFQVGGKIRRIQLVNRAVAAAALSAQLLRIQHDVRQAEHFVECLRRRDKQILQRFCIACAADALRLGKQAAHIGQHGGKGDNDRIIEDRLSVRERAVRLLCALCFFGAVQQPGRAETQHLAPIHHSVPYIGVRHGNAGKAQHIPLRADGGAAAHQRVLIPLAAVGFQHALRRDRLVFAAVAQFIREHGVHIQRKLCIFQQQSVAVRHHQRRGHFRICRGKITNHPINYARFKAACSVPIRFFIFILNIGAILVEFSIHDFFLHVNHQGEIFFCLQHSSLCMNCKSDFRADL